MHRCAECRQAIANMRENKRMRLEALHAICVEQRRKRSKPKPLPDPPLLGIRLPWPKERNVFGMRSDIWRVYKADLRAHSMNWTTYAAIYPPIADVLRIQLENDTVKPSFWLGDEARRLQKAA